MYELLTFCYSWCVSMYWGGSWASCHWTYWYWGSGWASCHWTYWTWHCNIRRYGGWVSCTVTQVVYPRFPLLGEYMRTIRARTISKPYNSRIVETYDKGLVQFIIWWHHPEIGNYNARSFIVMNIYFFVLNTVWLLIAGQKVLMV